MIKIAYIVLFLAYFNSCSSVQPVRKLASTTDGSAIIQYQVGEIKTSMLSPEAFLSLYGEVWVPLDGRDVTNSEFSALAGMEILPDARGKFLRMLNMGEKGERFDPKLERAAGSYQGDTFKSHIHPVGKNHGSPGGGGVGLVHANPSYGPHSTGGAGDDETRPKNIAVYYYIKINSCSTETYPCL